MPAWQELTEGLLAEAMTAFGEDVQFRPAGGEAFTGRAVPASPALPVALDGEVTVSSSAPVLAVRLSALPALLRQGDEGTVLTGRHAGRSFRIADVLEDGRGGARLPLHWLEP